MFGRGSVKQKLRNALGVAVGAIAGLGFLLLASATIQFEENVAPKFAGVGDFAAEIGRKLFSS
jgi:hypothetical protein